MKLMILDGNSVINRAFFGVKPLTNKEGAELYSIGLTKFQQLAKEAGAVIKVDKLVLVDCRRFEEFLESFREW